MTIEFVKRKPKHFFIDEKAILNIDLENIAGEKIAAGSIVTITSKQSNVVGVNIKSENGTIILSVWPEYLDLIK